MPSIPVPRWVPQVDPFCRYYFRARPAGWESNQLPSSLYDDAISLPNVKVVEGTRYPGNTHIYEQIGCTEKERLAGCRAYGFVGPRGLVGIWRPVPPEEWDLLDTSRLLQVRAYEPRTDEQLADWQYPAYWSAYLSKPPIVREVRDSWKQTHEELTQQPPYTLEQFFNKYGIPFDYRPDPPLVRPEQIPTDEELGRLLPRNRENYFYTWPKNGHGGLRVVAGNEIYLTPRPEAIARARQKRVDDIASKALAHRNRFTTPKGANGLPRAACPLLVGEGYPRTSTGPLFTLVSQGNATDAVFGEVCFEAEKRDTVEVWQYVRPGIAYVQSDEWWAKLKQFVAELTAKGL